MMSRRATGPQDRVLLTRRQGICILTLLFCAAATAQAPAVRDVPLHAKFKLLDQINADRKAHGLEAVKYSEELSRIADEHCREMLREDYASHWNRAGWKPYMRYTQGGLQDYTSENVVSAWGTPFPTSEAEVTKQMLAGQERMVNEQPPNDGHRRSILTAGHQVVGIGGAANERGLRMIEVFGRRDVELRGLPKSATLGDNVRLRARFLNRKVRVKQVSTFYEPLPQAMSREELSKTYSYGLPNEELVDRPFLGDRRYYADGSPGEIIVDPGVGFSVPVRFWKKQPGVYTVAVWLVNERGESYVGGMTTIFVER